MFFGFFFFSVQQWFYGLSTVDKFMQPGQRLCWLVFPVSDEDSFAIIMWIWLSIRVRWNLASFSFLFLSRCFRIAAAAAAAKSLQSCPTLCDPIDGSPPGSAVPGILQARTLEWVAISFSSAWKWKVKLKLLSHVRLFATPWTAAHQAPLSMEFSRQEYWSGLPLPSLSNSSSFLN